MLSLLFLKYDIISIERDNMGCIIRKREKSDCEAVAHVVTVAWNETYKGIVPNDFFRRFIFK